MAHFNKKGAPGVTNLSIKHEGFVILGATLSPTRPGVDKVKPKGWFKYSLQID